MTKIDKELWGLAKTLHGQIVHRGLAYDMASLEDDWQSIQKVIRQIQLAKEREWHLAANCLVPALGSAVDVLRHRLSEFHGALSTPAPNRAAASVPDIYRDLVALRDEFDDLCVDSDVAELCVTTTPVVLDDLRLGRFQIRLCWKHLSRSCAYEVVALEPNPARSNDRITHPHVDDDQLCEGEGSAAIRAALGSGRIGDFFTLVSQILNTYAAGNAYVELSAWHGSPCRECGAGVDDDDRCSCQSCDESVCADCMSFCAGCAESYCTGCLCTCNSCDGRFCSDCLGICGSCHADACEICLVQNRCPGCRKEQSNDEEEVQNDEAIEVPSVRATIAPIQSECLGEAAVLA